MEILRPDLTVSTEQAAAAYERMLPKLRWRVMCVSLCLLLFVVLDEVIDFVCETGAVREALGDISNIADLPPDVTRKLGLSMVVNKLSNAMGAIVIGVILAICGCLGAKMHNKSMVGCFCCCNAMMACLAIMGLIFTSATTMGISVGAPAAETYMKKCDPHQCISDDWDAFIAGSTSNDTVARVVDCFAAGIWQDAYTPLYDTKMPAMCPSVAFLQCEPDSTEPVELNLPFPVEFDAEDINGNSQYAVQVDAEVRRLRHVRHFGERHHSGDFDDFDFGEDPSKVFEQMGKAIPMPSDVMAQCRPQVEVIRRFHEVVLLFPRLIPKLTMLLMVKLCLLIPASIIACCAFCLGKDMFFHLHNGPEAIQAPASQPGVALPPVWGVVMEQPPATQPLTQPLMQVSSSLTAAPVVLVPPITAPVDEPLRSEPAVASPREVELV